jgi:LysM repeat protein
MERASEDAVGMGMMAGIMLLATFSSKSLYHTKDYATAAVKPAVVAAAQFDSTPLVGKISEDLPKYESAISRGPPEPRVVNSNELGQIVLNDLQAKDGQIRDVGGIDARNVFSSSDGYVFVADVIHYRGANDITIVTPLTVDGRSIKVNDSSQIMPAYVANSVSASVQSSVSHEEKVDLYGRLASAQQDTEIKAKIAKEKTVAIFTSYGNEALQAGKTFAFIIKAAEPFFVSLPNSWNPIVYGSSVAAATQSDHLETLLRDIPDSVAESRRLSKETDNRGSEYALAFKNWLDSAKRESAARKAFEDAVGLSGASKTVEKCLNKYSAVGSIDHIPQFVINGVGECLKLDDKVLAEVESIRSEHDLRARAGGKEAYQAGLKDHRETGIISNLNTIAEGSAIHLDPGTVYIVQKGDTLGEIAKKYDLTPEQLQDTNNLIVEQKKQSKKPAEVASKPAPEPQSPPERWRPERPAPEPRPAPSQKPDNHAGGVRRGNLIIK